MNKLCLSRLAIIGISFAGVPLAAMASTVKTGYTPSKTPLPGQHCYYHTSSQVYYCYHDKLQSSTTDNVAHSLKRTGQNTGESTKNTLERTGNGLEHTLKKTGQGFKNTLQKPFQ